MSGTPRHKKRTEKQTDSDTALSLMPPAVFMSTIPPFGRPVLQAVRETAFMLPHGQPHKLIHFLSSLKIWIVMNESHGQGEGRPRERHDLSNSLLMRSSFSEPSSAPLSVRTCLPVVS